MYKRKSDTKTSMLCCRTQLTPNSRFISYLSVTTMIDLCSLKHSMYTLIPRFLDVILFKTQLKSTINERNIHIVKKTVHTNSDVPQCIFNIKRSSL